MRIRWRGLELPNRVVADRATLTDTYGKFSVEPFERGFGVTVGNSLRRILLSSLEGSAVSSFSPVVRVKYSIEDTRVGQRTNYDKLVMEIWTNGTITPVMALVEGAKILRKHLNPFIQYAEPGPEISVEELGEKAAADERIDHELERKLNMSLAELELS